MSNNSNIVFNGLNIEGAKHTVEMSNVSNIKFQNCSIGKGAETAVYTLGANGLILDNCDIDAHWTLFYTKAYTTKGTTYRGVNEGLGAYSYLKNSEIKNCNFKNWGHAGIALTSFSTNSHTIKLKICDNAKGIDNSIIDQIFDPYFTTKEDSSGTGIGLYMSKIIIEENMNGTLEVKSSPKGSCFYITLHT